MTFSPPSQQVVCKELFDDSSEPTEDEIKDYALKIGIDIRNEISLLSLARDCLMQPLPPEWMPCYSAEHPDTPYYFNIKTKSAQWIHPLEEVHKSSVAKARNETQVISSSDQLDDESRTTVKEDLKSFEEAGQTESQISDMLPKPRLLEPLAPMQPRGALRVPPATLGLLKTASPATPTEAKKVSFDECPVKKRPNSSDIRNRRNIGPLELRHLSKQEIMTSRSHWRDEGYATESSAATQPSTQLTLAGGGGVFLKRAHQEGSPKKSADENNCEKSVPFKLEKELRVSFEVPDADDLSARKADLKQIEIDFEDLDINLQVPKEKPKTVPCPRTKESSQEKSSRSFKKSINIVLNGKNASQDRNREENLIDLTDGESASIEDGGKIPGASSVPVPLQLNELINIDGTQDGTDGDLDRTKQALDAAKAEKLKALEGEFNNWVKNTEKIFREKELQSYNNLKEKYEDWKKNEENGIIKEMGDRCAEELQMKVKILRNELLREEQEAVESLKASLAAQTRERLRALREEIQNKEEKELAELQKSLEESLANRKEELYKRHGEEMKRIERSLENLLAEQRVQRQQELEKAREDEAALAAMRAQLKDAFLQQKSVIQQEHEMALLKLKQQHEVEFFQAVGPKPQDIISPRVSLAVDDSSRRPQNGKEPSDPIVFEKLRCEKRLLEDKYKSLKEKYIRLKTDVKSSLDKKCKKKDLPQSASETEKSTSFKGNKVGDVDSPTMKRRTDGLEKKLKLKKQLNHLDNVNQNVSTEDEEMYNSKNVRGELSPSRGRGGGSSGDEGPDEARAASRKRRQLFSKLKAASTSRLHSGHRNEKDDVVSPVENLRRQLKKLEELEDQFPVSTHTDTYMRYPFTDAPAPQFASSELEFFKHRIHLERDSVRRAKEFLKTQKKCYENRQKELQHRLMDGPSSKSILEKIHQEERELTEMEVSVHRTRALLGEKIIRLRHLEHSLRRVNPEKRTGPTPRSVSREDGTLSDLSSHSDSSGFSSTHHNSEPIGPRASIEKNRRHLQTSMQESSEIIQSLENLNSEIRGIWEVLKQSAGPGAVQLPPPPMAWPAVRTNPTATLPSTRPLTMTQVSSVGVTTVVDPTLVERTRSLRDWLKSARRSPNPADVTSINQVTL